MPQIMTACWFANLPAGAVAVGVSRGLPRGKTGYHRLRKAVSDLTLDMLILQEASRGNY